MKIGRPLIILGLFILVSGIVFHLQGQSIVGPESSFMYANPDWLAYGIGIAMLGIMITSIGIINISRKIN